MGQRAACIESNARMATPRSIERASDALRSRCSWVTRAPVASSIALATARRVGRSSARRCHARRMCEASPDSRPPVDVGSHSRSDQVGREGRVRLCFLQHDFSISASLGPGAPPWIWPSTDR